MVPYCPQPRKVGQGVRKKVDATGNTFPGLYPPRVRARPNPETFLRRPVDFFGCSDMADGWICLGYLVGLVSPETAPGDMGDKAGRSGQLLRGLRHADYYCSKRWNDALGVQLRPVHRFTPNLFNR